MQFTEGFNSDDWASHFKCYLTGMNHPSKGDATTIIKEYVSMVKTRYGRTIRFMRANGETALATNFEEFMKTLGITVERTAAARAIRIHARLSLESFARSHTNSRIPTK